MGSGQMLYRLRSKLCNFCYQYHFNVLLRTCLSSDSFHLCLRFIGIQESPDRRHALQPSSRNITWALTTPLMPFCRLRLNPPNPRVYSICVFITHPDRWVNWPYWLADIVDVFPARSDDACDYITSAGVNVNVKWGWFSSSPSRQRPQTGPFAIPRIYP